MERKKTKKNKKKEKRKQKRRKTDLCDADRGRERDLLRGISPTKQNQIGGANIIRMERRVLDIMKKVLVVVAQFSTRRECNVLLHQSMHKANQFLPLLHVSRRGFAKHKCPTVREMEEEHWKGLQGREEGRGKERYL